MQKLQSKGLARHGVLVENCNLQRLDFGAGDGRSHSFLFDLVLQFDACSERGTFNNGTSIAIDAGDILDGFFLLTFYNRSQSANDL